MLGGRTERERERERERESVCVCLLESNYTGLSFGVEGREEGSLLMMRVIMYHHYLVGLFFLISSTLLLIVNDGSGVGRKVFVFCHVYPLHSVAVRGEGREGRKGEGGRAPHILDGSD